MKKIVILLILLLIPINVGAYSNYIIPGGETIGIEVDNNGIMVVGFYQVNNAFNRNKLKVGDTIVKVGNTSVYNINELLKAIEQEVNNNEVDLTIKRGKEELNLPFYLVKVNNSYKTGLYVKDNITGVGTLSYIDPTTKIYGALGHEIAESTTGNLIEVKTGNIFRSSVTSIDRSSVGTAGTKNAKFFNNTIYGDVNKNTIKGIYGTYTSDISNMSTLKVGTFNDIEKGKAYIYTVLAGEEIKPYEITIDNINNSKTKNIHFVITSDELLSKAGGIVQGMSGSPIIQNNMIIGAVTHVIVDNPTTGYGIFITSMLEEGDKQ